MKQFFLAVSLLLVFVYAERAHAQKQVDSCPITVPDGDTLGETFLCDRIEVPENWNIPGGRTIPISYVVLKSTGLAPFDDPVIFLQGGPGGSALNSLGLIAGNTKALRANRDIIVIEQRGTAHSNDLFCPTDIRVPSPETYDQDIADMTARTQEMVVDAYSDPDAVYELISDFFDVGDFRSCVPYLESRGIDLRQYNTASTVLDVIRLMEHLDYPAYNLFGASYGTTVALEMMDHFRLNPEAGFPPLRAVVIDGVAPRREFYEEAFIIPYIVLRTLADCEQDTACGEAYPDIRQRGIDLFSKLRAKPLARADAEDVTIHGLVELLHTAVTNQPALVPYLPRLVAELEQGQTDVYDLGLAAARHQVTLPNAVMQAPAQEDAQTGQAAVNAQLKSISEQFDAIEDSLSSTLISDGIIQDAILESTTRGELFVAILANLAKSGAGFAGNIIISKLEPFMIHPEQRTREGLAVLVQGAAIFPGLVTELRPSPSAFLTRKWTMSSVN